VNLVGLVSVVAQTTRGPRALQLQREGPGLRVQGSIESSFRSAGTPRPARSPAPRCKNMPSSPFDRRRVLQQAPLRSRPPTRPPLARERSQPDGGWSQHGAQSSCTATTDKSATRVSCRSHSA
jgi:hypothetical protein